MPHARSMQGLASSSLSTHTQNRAKSDPTNSDEDKIKVLYCLNCGVV